ncbi:D-alanyl-D-alanine carboxypeptidase/D-alanyl-D-alanine endopeptidase [Psychrobacillus lasiicapitis]|uniref:D-alanyl-D-alanine carboxypeptidase/D-alanyl-D-alanine-endopeptidase n=1 Tax=Psychrobacillus lasiicapitis TaxID=1636719 RepID=A0A544TCG8_9BACI|nr:D-alanyl-D-alanine carboxypeptidase/D-alanyl-D-alanine-endopeptidase [Psychrobacillus lasiicapitis]TQR15106.1 D-alanyl-D-alanine carboxypeptidase/D-alanyl-D-alanine-endopeptidase [Psychrobacillus lasiicapitis]GGA22507.1 D-alanyl-D-alanine carboxypeptidase DacC [Psychrobacillus lasiicapitis]
MNVWRKILVSFVALLMISSSAFIPLEEDSNVEAATSYANLQNKLNNIMADSRMKNATSSVTVRKASTGEVLYQYNGDKEITPASSLKLLTGAAALENLGENYRFSTIVLTDGKLKNGTLNGNLYVKGQGDPTLLKNHFDNFASSLAKQGIKRVSGNLVGDDTWYDNVRLSAGILAEDEPYYYAAPISALTLSPNGDFDAGSVIVEAKPGTNGKATKVSMSPITSVLKIVNNSKTVPKGSKNTLKITRQVGTNKVIISGNSPIGTSGVKEWISVTNPTIYALDIFKRSLAEKGITFATSSKVIEGKTPKNAKVLVSRKSMPLKELIIPFMKLSNNTHAEMLAKEMGKVKYGEGSWDAGLLVMHEYAASVGLDVTKWKFEDASGMSYSNKVSSSQLSQLLYVVRKEPWYNTYYKSLPIAGVSDRFVGGTLRNRLKSAPAKGNIQAKTGSLENIKSLSGYAKTKNGETLIFTVLTEKNKTSTIPVIDQLATTITNYK